MYVCVFVGSVQDSVKSRLKHTGEREQSVGVINKNGTELSARFFLCMTFCGAAININAGY